MKHPEFFRGRGFIKHALKVWDASYLTIILEIGPSLIAPVSKYLPTFQFLQGDVLER